MGRSYFPLFVDLSEKKIIVAGGGHVAARRVRALLSFTDHITVIAPNICGGLLKLEQDQRIRCLKREFRLADTYEADLVLAATNDLLLNHEIGIHCRKEQILVNVADCKELCDFYFPGIIMDDEITIGITANGKDHSKVKEIRKKIEKALK